MSVKSAERQASDRLAAVKAPRVSGTLGLAIILVAFVISVVNAGLETPNSFISMTLQPLIFVGMGLLLYHIGLHIHAVHQNVILMASNMDMDVRDDPPPVDGP